MKNSSNNKETLGSILWSFLMVIAMLPLTIIFHGIKNIGTASFAVPLANERIKTEKRRGIVTVDSSGRYNHYS